MKDQQKKNTAESGKMSIYEYEEKYVKKENTRAARWALRIIALVIGVFLAWCLFSVSVKLWEIHPYAGYAAAGVSVVLYVCLFIVPLVKIFKTEYFVTNVNSRTAGQAKRHNRKLRHSIAEKIVDLNASVDGVGWYDGEIVDSLELSLRVGDEEGIKTGLTALYNGRIKSNAKDVIVKCSLKSAMYSAVSQTSRTDAALVAVINLQMIKDIVFLYGFRPSDAKLVKIFGRVLQNSLVAYGLGGMKIGNSVVKTMGDAAKGIPLLGSVISAVVDSSVQGLTNGTLTAVIGFQTIKYLNMEYKLQNILDDVEIAETEEEFAEACSEIEAELRKSSRNRKLDKAAV